MSLGKISLSGVPVQIDILLGSGERENPEDSGEFTVIFEAGDAGGDQASAQKITANPPFVIQGEIRKEGDRDCYTFNGSPSKTYVIGVTGNRTLTVDGNKAIDGLIVYTPSQPGPVLICVSGGNNGAYVVTVFES